MRAVAVIGSVALILLVLFEIFESMVLPRRVTRPFRLARLYYLQTWLVWRAIGCRLPPGKSREGFLSIFGPFSLLGLFTLWIVLLVLAFALLYWGLTIPLFNVASPPDYLSYVYVSTGHFFTAGSGDINPSNRLGQLLAVAESGLGLGLIAVIIGYLPALFQAFSRREVIISLLDARAGSPPTVAEMLGRLALADHIAVIDPVLQEWERWAAEVLESHLSFPVLSYYRSQHDNQSWLAALTTILDTSALLILTTRGSTQYQAQLTFAMARHVAVDLSLIFHTPPIPPDGERLRDDQWPTLREALVRARLPGAEALSCEQLNVLRDMYEPFVYSLGQRLLVRVPAMLPERRKADNWQTSAWTPRTPGIGGLPAPEAPEHFN